MSFKIEKLSAHIATLGEGPHWDMEKQSLYYVDTIGETINRYSYEENKVYSASIENGKSPSFIIPVENEEGRFAVGLYHRVAVISWDGLSSKATVERIVFEIESDASNENYRFNDGKADPSGRLVTGTMYDDFETISPENRLGNLYTYSKAGKLRHIRSKIAISNGLTWNEKTKKMYYIDSMDYRVREFNYDIINGKIDEGRVLIDFHVNNEIPKFAPDGMTIDSEGFLYVAIWGGSKILKINPVDGKIEMSIDLPCEQVTSCAFGGPNLDILFITTAAFSGKPSPAGATFKVTGLGAKGLPMQKVQL